MAEPAISQNASDLSALKEVTLLLLGSTADHAVRCGDGDIEAFRQLVRESSDTINNAKTASQVLMSSGALSQGISQYFIQTQRRVDALLSDVGSTFQNVLRHLEVLHGAAESQSIEALRAVFEQGLREGSLGSAKEQALQSLGEWSQHAEEKRRQALELTGSLQDRITILEQSVPRNSRSSAGTSQTGGSSDVTVDSCTGLPVRSEAEAALNRALEGEVQSYAAVFYLHRMGLTNARFGEPIGNQVILFCSQHIATVVARGNDSLFRWSGPAFVAVLERPDSSSTVSAEVQRLISAPFSRFFETSSRSVYLPVKVTATVIPLFETNYAEVSAQMERFILNASGLGKVE